MSDEQLYDAHAGEIVRARCDFLGLVAGQSYHILGIEYATLSLGMPWYNWLRIFEPAPPEVPAAPPTINAILTGTERRREQLEQRGLIRRDSSGTRSLAALAQPHWGELGRAITLAATESRGSKIAEVRSTGWDPEGRDEP